MRHDVELLALACPIAQLKCFLAILFRHHALPKVAVHRAQPRIRSREIWIEFNRPLVERNGAHFIPRGVLVVSLRKRVQCFERGRGRLGQHHVVLLYRRQGFP